MTKDERQIAKKIALRNELAIAKDFARRMYGMEKLYKFQRTGVRKIESLNGRVLLADEMGLGKTLTTLAYLKRNPDALPAIVVCPASLKWVWEYEARKWYKMASTVLEGMKPPENTLLPNHDLTILNYEILEKWLPKLNELNAPTIIIDESHYIKNRFAKRTKAVAKLAQDKEHILALSGTPLTNRPAELYTTLHLLWPDAYPSFWSFAFKYCKPSKRSWGWEFNGACNLDELHTNLKKQGMIRRLKSKVLKDLPAKTREVVPLRLTNRKEYERAKNDFIVWLAEKSVTSAKKAMKAEKLVQMGHLKRLATELKMEGVMDWIDNFLESSDRKLVLYATHKKIIKQLRDRYGDIQVHIDGSVTGQRRKWAVQMFQKSKKIRIFIGNIRAASEGITLTAASDVAFVEMDWTPGKHSQAEDRIHRIGQKHPANIYYLIAKGTIEAHLCKIIQEKQKVLTNVLDGKTNRDRMNVFDLLEKALVKDLTPREVAKRFAKRMKK